MYTPHSDLSLTKTADLPMWRYMDFWKFLNLINTSKLFFANIQTLGDQTEGKMPARVYELMKEHDKKNGRNDNFADVYRDYFETKTRENGFVLSWTASEKESFAMWKMYAKDKLGIAIKTDLSRLKKSFKNESENIYIGEVKNFDNQNPEYDFNKFSNFICKNNYYEFESEVRCIVHLNSEKNRSFKLISVDLNDLIEEIYISPFAEETGLVEIINFISQKKNLHFKIKISAINDNWL